ncbi:protein kinase [Microseira sp. BLCC-F43]|jgi:serine/threonine protein kinase|uniref:protein kinase domain-containing protein n=1 Tax=Microseira sp. BLCC-F43 TaxID=3153602 RepID=UPI0035B9EC62
MMDRSDSHNITSHPDCAKFGYQIERELGHNKSGGRVTYLATNTKTATPVIVKQFQFARVGATWSDYHAHEREIELLQQLNHPSIPKYLNSFETTDGFCLVQEYKPAASLAQPESFTPQEIKQIALAVLEILVYLQQQNPPVIHRDIKPENILVDRAESLKVYLVDFGLARIEGEEVAATSAVKGTLGFMPPEQMFNRPLTEASDLYSLGATLICLLTKTKSTEIGNLIDENCRINFQPLMPKLNPQFIAWLEKMVAPNFKHRYPNAATALTALQSIDILAPSTTLGRLSPKTKKILLINLGLVAACGTIFIIGDRILNDSTIGNSSITVRELQQMGKCVGCDLKGANFRGADLRSLDLTNADLTGADLRGADLRGSYLKNANLTNADLRDANLASTDLRGAIMPDGSIHRID